MDIVHKWWWICSELGLVLANLLGIVWDCDNPSYGKRFQPTTSSWDGIGVCLMGQVAQIQRTSTDFSLKKLEGEMMEFNAW